MKRKIQQYGPYPSMLAFSVLVCRKQERRLRMEWIVVKVLLYQCPSKNRETTEALKEEWMCKVTATMIKHILLWLAKLQRNASYLLKIDFEMAWTKYKKEHYIMFFYSLAITKGKFGMFQMLWFALNDKQGNKCSYISMFHLFNVLTADKRKEWNGNVLNTLIWHMCWKKRQKCSTAWMKKKRGMFWMFWLDMKNRSTNVARGWRCWLKQFTATLKDIQTDLSIE